MERYGAEPPHDPERTRRAEEALAEAVKAAPGAIVLPSKGEMCTCTRHIGIHEFEFDPADPCVNARTLPAPISLPAIELEPREVPAAHQGAPSPKGAPGGPTKCRWCDEGNSPIRSSVTDAMVHHTSVGRVLCRRNWTVEEAAAALEKPDLDFLPGVPLQRLHAEQLAAMKDFADTMEREVIPEILKAVRMRAERAANSRRWILFSPGSDADPQSPTWRERAISLANALLVWDGKGRPATVLPLLLEYAKETRHLGAVTKDGGQS